MNATVVVFLLWSISFSPGEFCSTGSWFSELKLQTNKGSLALKNTVHLFFCRYFLIGFLEISFRNTIHLLLAAVKAMSTSYSFIISLKILWSSKAKCKFPSIVNLVSSPEARILFISVSEKVEARIKALATRLHTII